MELKKGSYISIMIAKDCYHPFRILRDVEIIPGMWGKDGGKPSTKVAMDGKVHHFRGTNLSPVIDALEEVGVIRSASLAASLGRLPKDLPKIEIFGGW